MSIDGLSQALGHTRRILLRQPGTGLTDGQLLERFLAGRDEAAFEALVVRHGPMVLGVCRRIVGDSHDAEDAFQATFLVLAVRAASVAPADAVGNWLHGVAQRTALKARGVAQRRRARERHVADPPHPLTREEYHSQEQALLLHREVSRLPDEYRLPVIMCELEGRPRREVARQLGLSDGTLTRRLAEARSILARRLGADAWSLLLAPAAVPTVVLRDTVTAAAALAAGGSAAALVSTHVLALMNGDAHAMLLTRIKLFTALALAGVVVGVAQPGYQPPPPAAGGPGVAAVVPRKDAKRFPVWATSKAFVEKDDKDGLTLRAEIPCGRFLKLTDADNKPVFVHEFVTWQPPKFTVKLKDLRAFTVRGKELKVEEWVKGLTEDQMVLLEFNAGNYDGKHMAEAFRLYREDLVVLVLSPDVLKPMENTKPFAPAKSLPQVFPGQKGNGDVVPPPKP